LPPPKFLDPQKFWADHATAGIMQWWACSLLNPLYCLQRQVAKLGNGLFSVA